MAWLKIMLLTCGVFHTVSSADSHHISKRTYGMMRGGYRGGYRGGFGGGYRRMGSSGAYRGFGGGYRGYGGGGYGGGGFGGGGFGGGLNALTTTLYSRILDGMYGGGFGGIQYVYVPVYVPVDDGTVVVVDDGGGYDIDGPGIIDIGGDGGELDFGGVGNNEAAFYLHSDAKTAVRVRPKGQPTRRLRIGKERVVQRATELGLGRTYALTPPTRPSSRSEQG